MKKPRSTFILLGLLLLALTAVILFRKQYIAPLPFDPGAWADGEQKLRFLMKNSLIAKHKAGELSTREAVDRALGIADEQSDESRYYLMDTWIGVPWYLRVRFNGEGQVTSFSAHPH